MDIINGAGFRNFASRVKEGAKKIPSFSFDDMAANDSYIHSSDFNTVLREGKKNTDKTTSINIDSRNLDKVSHSDRSSSQLAASSLLSIVSDALQQPSTIKHTFPSTTSKDGSKNDDDDDDDGYSSNSEQSSKYSSDEEDPIFLMIRSNKMKKKINLHSENIDSTDRDNQTKSSNRFVVDLNRRLQTSENGNNTVKENQLQETNESESKNNETFFNRMFRGSRMNEGTSTTPPRSSPPLSRERRPAVIAVKPEESFDITTVTAASMLAGEDLERLEQLKDRSKISISTKTITKNHHFLFIAFTLLLAIYVYFNTRKNFEDNIT